MKPRSPRSFKNAFEAAKSVGEPDAAALSRIRARLEARRRRQSSRFGVITIVALALASSSLAAAAVSRLVGKDTRVELVEPPSKSSSPRFVRRAFVPRPSPEPAPITKAKPRTEPPNAFVFENGPATLEHVDPPANLVESVPLPLPLPPDVGPESAPERTIVGPAPGLFVEPKLDPPAGRSLERDYTPRSIREFRQRTKNK